MEFAMEEYIRTETADNDKDRGKKKFFKVIILHNYPRYYMLIPGYKARRDKRQNEICRRCDVTILFYIY